MVSMKDVSKRCGVSVATVSKALNDHSDIGEATKKLVRETARQMGYFPNASAKQLKTNKSHNIGVLFMDEAGSGLTHDFYANILESIKVTAEARGYDITFINTNKKALNMTYLEHSRYRGFDGVAIACARYDDPEVMELALSDIPVVTIDHIFEKRSAIMSDNTKGMKDLLTFIYEECGHRAIAYIHGEDSRVTRSRIECFRQFMEDHNISIPEGYVVPARYRDTKLCAQITKRLLLRSDRPTCILCPDDFSAIGAINAAAGMGLSIPRDISIAGYDGINIAKTLEPKITTIEQNTDKMGKRAAECLIDSIEKPEIRTALRVVVEGTLLKGDSVRCLN